MEKNLPKVSDNSALNLSLHSSRASLSTFLSQVLQLALVGFIVYALNIEADLGFVQFFPILLLAFIAHSLTVPQYRPIVFLASFVVTLYLFLGNWDASILLLLGLFIFWICHLPVPLGIRKLLVLAVGVLLALAKIGYFWFPLSGHGLTVIAAIFMFRVIVYLHELKHQKEAASIWHRLNYFFLLPNIIFPLFPIVDYQTYLKNYYDDKDLIIYQKGINLIIWSLICLLTYRWLYYFVVPDLNTIYGVGDVALYIASTYLTVIRLVGIFTLSVGILRLFGYNLPDIFRYMFFASSFLDLFRRINIYWKHFLMKICFYPIYIRIRKIIPAYALALSMLFTFFFTWVFHIYQWAWVLGTNPIRDTSLLFWGIFGILATVNSLYDGKKKRTLHTMGNSMVHATKVVGVFTTMAILYSMWTNSTFIKWLGIVQVAFQDDLNSWLKVIAIILTVIIMGGLFHYAYVKYVQNSKWDHRIQQGTTLTNYLALGLLCLFISKFSGNPSDSKMAIFINNFELNANDANQEYDGYYEDILNSNISSKLWDDQIDQHLSTRNWKDLLLVTKAKSLWQSLKNDRPNESEVDNFEKINKTRKARRTGDVLYREYLPNQKASAKGKRFSTNQWGLRDKEYSKIPPKNATRIAIMGSSTVLGSGIHDEEIFDRQVEDRLNEEFGSDTSSYELINFARGRKYVAQQAYMLEHQVLDFKPDFVVLFVHFKIKGKLIELLQKVKMEGGELYPELEAILEESNIDLENLAGPSQLTEQARIITKWSYPHFNTIVEKYQIPTVLVYFPSFVDVANHYEELKPIIDSIGLDFIDMKDVFDGYDKRSLFVSDHDRHPNALAHQIIADRFYRELVAYLNLKQK